MRVLRKPRQELEFGEESDVSAPLLFGRAGGGGCFAIDTACCTVGSAMKEHKEVAKDAQMMVFVHET